MLPVLIEAIKQEHAQKDAEITELKTESESLSARVAQADAEVAASKVEIIQIKDQAALLRRMLCAKFPDEALWQVAP